MARARCAFVLWLAAALLYGGLQVGLRAAPQDAESAPLVLKSAAHAVPLDVFVSDSAGRPVHGLRKSDFVVTDNGHAREIRIFGGEAEGSQPTARSTDSAAPPDAYSNRIGMRDSHLVTALVFDAVPRAEGLREHSISCWSTSR